MKCNEKTVQNVDLLITPAVMSQADITAGVRKLWHAFLVLDATKSYTLGPVKILLFFPPSFSYT